MANSKVIKAFQNCPLMSFNYFYQSFLYNKQDLF